MSVLLAELSLSVSGQTSYTGNRTVPHLAALNQLDPDEQQVIRTLIEATLLRHQARKLAG